MFLEYIPIAKVTSSSRTSNGTFRLKVLVNEQVCRNLNKKLIMFDRATDKCAREPEEQQHIFRDTRNMSPIYYKENTAADPTAGEYVFVRRFPTSTC